MDRTAKPIRNPIFSITTSGKVRGRNRCALICGFLATYVSSLRSYFFLQLYLLLCPAPLKYMTNPCGRHSQYMKFKDGKADPNRKTYSYCEPEQSNKTSKSESNKATKPRSNLGSATPPTHSPCSANLKGSDRMCSYQAYLPAI